MTCADDLTHTYLAKTGHENAECGYFSTHRCASCNLLSITPGHRIDRKIKTILSALGAHRITPTQIEEIVLAASPWGSRRKIKMAITGSAIDPIIGIVRQDLSSEDLSECPLMPEMMKGILEYLRNTIRDLQLPPYDINNKTGELKYLLLTSTSDGKEAILRFVLRSPECVPLVERIVPLLQEAFPSLTVITCNIQPLHAAILEGDQEIFLTSVRAIRDTFNGIPLYFSPQSFMQVTPEIAQRLYQRALEFIQKHRPRSVLDLYCGVGGFSLHAAKDVPSVIGVEVSPSAIENALQGAQEIGAQGVSFCAADVEHFLTERTDLDPELIIVNPPRRGLSEQIIDHILRLKPRNILYSSCNPETFARDARLLTSRYSLGCLSPFDMFPMTSHCEVLGEFLRLD